MSTKTSWIEAVLQLNVDIVAAQTRLERLTLALARMIEGYEDTTATEAALRACTARLDGMRSIQNQLLKTASVLS